MYTDKSNDNKFTHYKSFDAVIIVCEDFETPRQTNKQDI